MAGPWRIGELSNYVTNDYLFEIPSDWAAVHAPGKRLATGRFRDGRWGGLGPALVAYEPPNEGNPPKPNATIERVKPLILYGVPRPGVVELEVSDDRKMKSFSEPDDWTAGAWLTAGDQAAVVLIGTKARGRSWYGFSNGAGFATSNDPNDPVPEVPPFPHDSRGYWSEEIAAQILFFDPNDLAAVAEGKADSWQPQPYATLDIDQHLFDPGYDHERYKRYPVGAAAFDRARGILYIIERRADEERSVIHVFKIGK